MPSIVVMSFPAAADTGMEHDRMGLPLRCTVQAPHWAMPHPYLVPVSPARSRMAHNNGILGSASTVKVFSLIFNVYVAMTMEFMEEEINVLKIMQWRLLKDC